MHKTGTTYLQRRFAQNRDRLRETGVLFPAHGFVDHGDVGLKDQATPGHQGILNAAREGDRAFFRQFERKVRSSGCGTVLISCENLWAPYREPEARMKMVRRFGRFLDAFPRRRMVAVLRRPDAYVEALYRERVTSHRQREVREIGPFVDECADSLCDYASALQAWETFSGGNLTLIDYAALRRGGNTFEAFCSALGIGLPEGIAPADAATVYPTPGRDTIALVRTINAMVDDETIRREIVRELMRTGASGETTSASSSALRPDRRLDLIRRNRAACEGFFRARGFAFDYEAMLRDVATEATSWQPPAATDLSALSRLLERHGVARPAD